MTTYICKVYTPEYFNKIQEYIKSRTKNSIGIQKEFDVLNIKYSLIAIHNNKFDLNDPDNAPLIKHYQDNDMLIPQFTIQEFLAAETGYQSQPRIVWKDKVQKIDDIDEIFHLSIK